MADREALVKLEVHRACGYVACICPMLKHAKECTRRKAVLDQHPVACTPHGSFACDKCFPCDCPQGTMFQPGAAPVD